MKSLTKCFPPDRKGHQNTWPAGRPINLSFVSLFAVAGVHLAEDRGGSRGQRLKVFFRFGQFCKTWPTLKTLKKFDSFGKHVMSNIKSCPVLTLLDLDVECVSCITELVRVYHHLYQISVAGHSVTPFSLFP